MKKVTPEAISRDKSLVIDVREFPEYVAGAIAGSQLVPLSTIESASPRWKKDQPLVLVCRSGRRAEAAATKLEGLGFQNIAVLEGGMDAWKSVGLPTTAAAKKPWSLERQVRAIAGSLVLISSLLGLTVSIWFFALTLFVGAGLTFAGISDVCLMATALGKMPWNRQSAA